MINLKLIKDAGFAGKASPPDAGRPVNKGKGKGGIKGGGKKGALQPSAFLTSNYGWWEMDEASGDRMDYDQKYHLLDQNTVTSGDPATDGVTSAFFTAANSEFMYANDTNADVNFDGDNSFYGQIYVPSAWPAGSQVVYGTSYSAARHWLLYVLSSATPGEAYLWWLGSNTIAYTVQDSGLNLDAWNHVYWQWDETNAELGISVNNRTLVTTSTGVARPRQSANIRFAFGRDSFASGNYFDGYARKAKYYHRLLTEDERTYLYNNPLFHYDDTGGRTPVTESFWGHSWTDTANTFVANTRLGYRFYLTEDQVINTVSVNSAAAGLFDERVMIHRDFDGVAVVDETITPTSVGAWKDQTLSSPVTLAKNHYYTISARAGGTSRTTYRNYSDLAYDANVNLVGYRYSSDDNQPTLSTTNQYAFCRFGYV